MNKTTLISIAALMIALVSLGLSLMPRGMVPQLGSSPKQWREIASFSGSGNTTTATFYVPSYLWRVSWNVTWGDFAGTYENPGRFLAYIYSPGVIEQEKNALSGFSGYLLPAHSKNDGIESFYGIGNENLYFKVETLNVKHWYIEAEAWS